MHTVIAIIFLLATTGRRAYTLETRSSPPDCMDPDTQPELLVSSSLYHAFIKPSHLAKATFQVKTECVSSLTSPSSCLHRLSYIKDCVAYCEQCLYWFFGPEVPFPGSDCEADEKCTFAGAESVAVTNSRSFDIDLSAKFPSENVEVAFNIGASHTYSTTKTTSRILT